MELDFKYRDEICVGEALNIENKSHGVDSNAIYYFDLNSDGTNEITAIASDLPEDTSLIIPLPIGTYDFTVIVVNPDGCSDTLVSSLEVELCCDDLELEFEFEDEVCQEEPISIENESEGVDPNAIYYLDLDSDGSVEFFVNASDLPTDTSIILPLTDGTYDFTVFVVNPDGCSDTISSTLEIDDCSPNADDCQYRTQTQGGWGTLARGNNPGTYRDAYFDSAFVSGLTVGCDSGYTLTLLSSQAVEDFLPSGSTPRALMSDLTDPGQSYSNVFAAQLVALTLSVGFENNDSNFAASATNLADAVVIYGDFYGWTVQMVLDLANDVFGGCDTSYTATQLSDILADINESYVDGELQDSSILSCDSCNVKLNFSADTACLGGATSIVNLSTGVDSAAIYYLDIYNDRSIDLSANAVDLPSIIQVVIPVSGIIEFKVIVVNGNGCTDTLVTTLVVSSDTCQAIIDGGNVQFKLNSGIDVNADNDQFLLRSYPNPFRNQVTIEFKSATTEIIKLDILSLDGRIISTLFDGDAQNGHLYKMQFDGSKLASGIYIYRLITQSGDMYLNKLILGK